MFIVVWKPAIFILTMLNIVHTVLISELVCTPGLELWCVELFWCSVCHHVCSSSTLCMILFNAS